MNREQIIGAIGFDPDATTEQQAKELLKTGLAAIADPWCGICKSRELHFETAPTRFETMTEAAPHLRAEAEKQASARAFFQSLRRTARNN